MNKMKALFFRAFSLALYETYYTENETVFAITQSFLQTIQSPDSNRLLLDDCFICKKL